MSSRDGEALGFSGTVDYRGYEPEADYPDSLREAGFPQDDVAAVEAILSGDHKSKGWDLGDERVRELETVLDSGAAPPQFSFAVGLHYLAQSHETASQDPEVAGAMSELGLQHLESGDASALSLLDAEEYAVALAGMGDTRHMGDTVTILAGNVVSDLMEQLRYMDRRIAADEPGAEYPLTQMSDGSSTHLAATYLDRVTLMCGLATAYGTELPEQQEVLQYRNSGAAERWNGFVGERMEIRRQEQESLEARQRVMDMSRASSLTPWADNLTSEEAALYAPESRDYAALEPVANYQGALRDAGYQAIDIAKVEALLDGSAARDARSEQGLAGGDWLHDPNLTPVGHARAASYFLQEALVTADVGSEERRQLVEQAVEHADMIRVERLNSYDAQQMAQMLAGHEETRHMGEKIVELAARAFEVLQERVRRYDEKALSGDMSGSISSFSRGSESVSEGTHDLDNSLAMSGLAVAYGAPLDDQAMRAYRDSDASQRWDSFLKLRLEQNDRLIQRTLGHVG